MIKSGCKFYTNALILIRSCFCSNRKFYYFFFFREIVDKLTWKHYPYLTPNCITDYFPNSASPQVFYKDFTCIVLVMLVKKAFPSTGYTFTSHAVQKMTLYPTSAMYEQFYEKCINFIKKKNFYKISPDSKICL